MSTRQKEFGIDAPYIVRNLFLFSFLAAAGMLLCFFIPSRLWFWICFISCFLLFVNLFVTAWWMLYSTLRIKPLLIKELVNRLKLEGKEILLDVGCGRGMLLIEAARHLPQGIAHGIDLWSPEDQSDNSFAATTQNIAAVGLIDRIKLYTADMRKIPYPDGMFDVVVSSLALHNIPDAAGRQRALLEILRVLKPHGTFALLDIHFAQSYTAFLNQTGMAKAICHPKIYRYCPPIQLIEGKKLI
jgi:arsenite methyltransferase